jgi:hypothetical protein
MAFFANPQEDLPQPWKLKRIIFYAQGLKIYGQIPYVLQRRLQGEFYSNNAPFMGMRLIVPTFENNYTLVRYHRLKDGKRHSEIALESLLDWLYSDEGFEWAIAKDFFRQIDLPNFWNWPPETFVLGGPEHRPDIKQLLLTAPEEGEQDAGSLIS